MIRNRLPISACLAVLLAGTLASDVDAQLRIHTEVFKTKVVKGKTRYQPLKVKPGQDLELVVRLYYRDVNGDFQPWLDDGNAHWEEELLLSIPGKKDDMLVGDHADGEFLAPAAIHGGVDLILGASRQLPDDLDLALAWFTTQATVQSNRNRTYQESPPQLLGYSIVAGPAGPAGADGKDGEDGEQGPQGEPGAQGPQGEQGPQGVAGIPGDAGPQGPAGPTGPKGDQGDPGPKGDQGVQGPQGLQGPKGDQGLQGIQGPKGDQGVQGPQGAKGDDGMPFIGQMGTSGYVDIGTLRIQWGRAKSTLDGTQIFAFPKPFAFTYSVVLSRMGANIKSSLGVESFTTASFAINRENGIDGTADFHFFATGRAP